MPAASEILPSEVLGTATIPYVPLLIIHDESEFARTVITTLSGVLDARFVAAVKVETAALAEPPVRDASEPRPPHLAELTHLPPWTIWILSDGTTSSLPSALTSDNTSFASHTRFLFLKVADTVKDVPPFHESVFCFAFSEICGDLKRSGSQLAQGVVYYFLAAWRRYCEKNDGRVSAALLLPEHPEGKRLYTLGFGTAGPDIAYHTTRWTRLLADALRREWLKEPDDVPASQWPSAKEVVDFHLPHPEFLAVDGETHPRRNEFIITPEVVTVTYYRELPQLARRHLFGAREQLAESVVTVNKHYSILRLAALPQALRIFKLRASKFSEFVQRSLDAFLIFPESPRGLFGRLKSQLTAAEGWLESLAEAKSSNPPHKPPHTLILKARHRVEKFPNLSGGLLRLALILVAFVWLIFAPQIVARFAPAVKVELPLPFIFGINETHGIPGANKELLARTDWLIGALVIAVFAWWAFAIFKVGRLLDNARRFAVTRLLLAATEVIEASVRGSGKDRREQVRRTSRELEHVRSDFSVEPNALAELAGRNTDNREPRFSDATIDALLNSQREKLTTTAHACFLQNLGGTPIEWNLDSAAWETALQKAAAVVAADAIRALPFETLAEKLNLSASDKSRLLETAITDARKPAFPTNCLVPKAGLCVLGSRWQQFAGRYDEIVFCDQSASHLAVIIPVPVTTHNIA